MENRSLSYAMLVMLISSMSFTMFSFFFFKDIQNTDRYIMNVNKNIVELEARTDVIRAELKVTQDKIDELQSEKCK